MCVLAIQTLLAFGLEMFNINKLVKSFRLVQEPGGGGGEDRLQLVLRPKANVRLHKGGKREPSDVFQMNSVEIIVECNRRALMQHQRS